MTSPYAYELAHARVKRLHGPARYYPCDFCGLGAHDWALDWESPEVVRDQQWRAYSPDPNFYMPLCRSCHKTYDMHVSRFGADPVGVLKLRDRLWRAVDPELRAVKREHLLSSYQAYLMWATGAVDVLFKRTTTFEEHLPEPTAETPGPEWFPVLFTLDADASVPGAEAYKAYCDWCEAKPLTRNAFYAVMVSCGAKRKKTNAGIALTGVKLS
ncbi:hypothetical protein ACFY65_26205 [Streptomyces cellulosae]